MKTTLELQRQIISNNWWHLSKKLKDKFPQPTKSDLKYEKGNEMELLIKIGNRLHIGIDNIVKIIITGLSYTNSSSKCS